MQASSSRDRRLAAVAAALAFVVVAQQVGGKAIRDALFLAAFGPEQLPFAMALTVAVAVVSMALTSRLVVWVGPKRFLLLGLAGSGALFTVAAGLSQHSPGMAGWLLYVLIAVFGSIISSFWSLVTESLPPSAGRRLIGRVSTGATLGGLAGAGLAKGFAALLGSSGCLALLAGFSLLSLLLTSALPRGTGKRVEEAPRLSTTDGTSRSYLMSIAALVFVTAVVSGVADYVLKAKASELFTGREDDLLSFFATFYTVVSLVTVVVQALLSKPILERLGLSAAVATLPGSVFALSVLALGSGHWLAYASIRGADSVFSNSIFRSGYELLYTPVPVALSRRFKALIDVGALRAGDLTAAGTVLLLAQASQLSFLVSLCAALSAVALAALRWVHSGYVRSLTSSVQEGTLDLKIHHSSDLTTLRTLSEATATLDRASLLRSIADYEQKRASSNPPPQDTGSPHASSAWLSDYRSHEPADLPEVVEQLADPEAGSLAERAVRYHLRRQRKELLDTLFSEEVSLDARLVLARLFAEQSDAWLEQLLIAGLAHPSRPQTLVCAETLSRLPVLHKRSASSDRDSAKSRSDRSLGKSRPRADPIRDAVLRFADRELSFLEAEPGEARSGVKRVFRLLAVTHNRKQLNAASKGFFSDDPRVVGSSIELVAATVSPDIARRLEALAVFEGSG